MVLVPLVGGQFWLHTTNPLSQTCQFRDEIFGWQSEAGFDL
jgi:hypothetical protein